MTGWIKIWRQLLEWEWADVPEMMALWVRLLLMANHDTTTWHGEIIAPGQLVTTYSQLASLSGLTVKQVRVCIARLSESGQIRIERAGKRQLVSISNYKQFQELENEKGQQKGTERAAKGQQKGSKRAGSINKENIRSKEEENNNPLTPLQGDAPKPKAEKEKCHAVTRYDRTWDVAFKYLTGDDFSWTRRENVSVNAIVGKITAMMEAGGRDPTDDEKEDAFRVFVTKLWEAGDAWVRTNFVPHVIDSKFNEYYQQIKQHGKINTTKPGNPAGVSADYIARVASQLAG